MLHIHTLLIVLLACCCLVLFIAHPLITDKPVCVRSVCFVLPSISRYLYADPVHCNMTCLLFRLLKDDLKEYTYAAGLAGLVYDVSSGKNALLVSSCLEPGSGVSAGQGSALGCNGVEMAWFSTLGLTEWRVFMQLVDLVDVFSLCFNQLAGTF